MVTGKAEGIGLVTLQEVDNELQLNLSAEDMSKANKEKDYYAAVPPKDYETDETNGTHTIAEVEVTNGPDNLTYNCKLDIEVIVEESLDYGRK